MTVQGRSLLNNPGNVNILSELYLMSNLPGTLYTADEQCQLFVGPGSNYSYCSVSLIFAFKWSRVLKVVVLVARYLL